MRDELTINKENYKGYVELYKMKKDQYFKQISVWGAGISLNFSIMVITILINPSFLNPIFIALCLTLLAGITLTVVDIKNFKNKKLKNLNLKYPNIDINKSTTDIENSLEKVGIIEAGLYGNTFDVKNYESRLMKEELSIYDKSYEEVYQTNNNLNLDVPKIKKIGQKKYE